MGFFFRAKNTFLQFMKFFNNAASMKRCTAPPTGKKTNAENSYLKHKYKFYGIYTNNIVVLSYMAMSSIILAVPHFGHWVSDVCSCGCKQKDYNSQRQRTLA